jgi:hypothetical protein
MRKPALKRDVGDARLLVRPLQRVTNHLEPHLCKIGVGGCIPALPESGLQRAQVKHFAAALGPRRIRVNGVAPGVVETDMSGFTKTQAGRDFTLGMQALKRLAQPDDIGGGVAFIAPDDARRITGDTIHIDGGSKR